MGGEILEIKTVLSKMPDLASISVLRRPDGTLYPDHILRHHTDAEIPRMGVVLTCWIFQSSFSRSIFAFARRIVLFGVDLIPKAHR